MLKSLLLVWILAVIAFFVLWALIALMVRRISERKNHTTDVVQEETSEKEVLPKQPS